MDKELPVSAWPEWKIIEKIGEGSFGKVYRAQRTERGKSFYSAIKIINIPGASSVVDNGRHLPGAASLCGLRKGVFARGASSLLFRRLQGRREPPKKPGTHEENAGEKAGRLLRFAASKGLTFRAFLRVFPGWEYLITFLPGLPSYFVTSSTSGHVSPRHRKEVSLGDSTRICDFESCHL